jgi:hypothetical protein
LGVSAQYEGPAFWPGREVEVLRGITSSVMTEFATFRALFPLEPSGLNSVTLFIDGDDHSNFRAFINRRVSDGLDELGSLGLAL